MDYPCAKLSLAILVSTVLVLSRHTHTNTELLTQMIAILMRLLSASVINANNKMFAKHLYV